AMLGNARDQEAGLLLEGYLAERSIELLAGEPDADPVRSKLDRRDLDEPVGPPGRPEQERDELPLDEAAHRLCDVVEPLPELALRPPGDRRALAPGGVPTERRLVLALRGPAPARVELGQRPRVEARDQEAAQRLAVVADRRRREHQGPARAVEFPVLLELPRQEPRDVRQE